MNTIDIIHESERSFGFVPGFVERAPEKAIGPLWNLVKDLLIKDTVIPRSYKVLVILAVASYLRGESLIQGARELACAMGLSNEEVQGALAIAGDTVLFSTWFNGYVHNMTGFETDMHQMLKKVGEIKSVPPAGRLNTREEVFKDIETIFGIVPGLIKALPDDVLVNLWPMIRGVELEGTIIPYKYRRLIRLAVASVIPCQFCTTMVTEVARASGASDEEIKETILLGATTHVIGTLISGLHYDPEKFAKDISRMAKTLRKVPVAV